MKSHSASLSHQYKQENRPTSFAQNSGIVLSETGRTYTLTDLHFFNKMRIPIFNMQQVKPCYQFYCWRVQQSVKYAPSQFSFEYSNSKLLNNRMNNSNEYLNEYVIGITHN